MHESPLMETMKDAGAVFGDYHGRPLARNFGDPAGEYAAATGAAAVFDRSHRTRLLVTGRSPADMLNGILTGTMPAEPAISETGVLVGAATYHCVLSPKGKMITDLCALRRGDEESGGFLLDVPVAGSRGLVEHLGRFLPPRFARVEDVSTTTAQISVSGPEAAERLSRLALGLRVDPVELCELTDGEWRSASASAVDGLLVVRTGDVWPHAFNVAGPSGAVAAVYRALIADGVRPAGLGVWSTLRVETARPVFGTDMDEKTIPVEAGIHDRAIDYDKGCYTGQEVIVRIRDRGHVNRHLRLVMLGDVPTPAKGAELFTVGDTSGKVAGVVTSAVESPRYGQTVALAYVKRGVEGELRPA